MKKIYGPVIFSIILLLFGGCNTSDEFNNIEEAISKQIHPAILVSEIKFGLVGSLAPARVMSAFGDATQEADEFLKEVKGVQVGVYKIHNIEESNSFKFSNKVDKCLIEKGWEPFVHVRKRNKENVSLFYRQLSESIASIYVLALKHDELFIVEINGNLDKILEKAICERRVSAVDRI